MNIQSDYTFIIGAGASKDISPFFGTGVEMFNQILDSVAGRSKEYDDKLNYFLMNGLNLDYSDIVSFVTAMEDYKKNVAIPSFDEFMSEIRRFPEYNNNRNKFEKIGQYSLIRCVLKWENSLMTVGYSRGSTWIHMLINYVKSNQLWKSNDHLKIVTFNYDRVIEFVMLNDGGTFRDEIIEWCKNNITHVYGYIGFIKEPNNYHDLPESLSFGNPTYDLNMLEPFIKNIKMQYDDRLDSNGSTLAADIVANANNISIFGFGYDFVNCRHLGLNQQLNGKMIYANINPFDDPNFLYRRSLTNKIRAMQPNTIFSYNSCTKFIQDQLQFEWNWKAKI
jgi:hypothetical protein